jgi:phosphatidate cytidylyltransferase
MERSDPEILRALLIRSISGGGVVAAILGGIWAGGWVWSLVAASVALASLLEFYGLLRTEVPVSRRIGLGAAALLLAAAAAGLSLAALLSVLSLLALVVLLLEILRRQATGESAALKNLGGTLAGVVYVILPWAFMIRMRQQDFGALFLLTLFCCTWACDVAAYLTGMRFGRLPLCESVSPKKTWEGFAGGVAGSLLVSALLAFALEYPPLPMLLLGLLCGVAGQLGDLGESILKREAGVKDSGRWIPGHGGFLDRFDSILVNASLAFLIFEVLAG